ncbi:MAG: ribonuclease HII [Promethearchaeati archaeon SRVP18_Atabeyarchaeia-1]
MTKLIGGIDEAGRGPVIGPMVLAGVVMREDRLQKLVDMGARDSKKLTPKKRAELAPLIECAANRLLYVEVTPEEIDARVDKGITLNQLEAEKIVFMINQLKPDKVYIDCPDVNPERFTQWLKNGVKSKQVEIVAQHYADESIPVVSAASIVAKVRRDNRLKELSERLGDIGSGYPSDPRTMLYLEKALAHGDRMAESHTSLRHSWATVKRLRK